MFDVNQEIERIIQFIKDAYDYQATCHNRTKILISASGGTESSIAAALVGKAIDAKDIVLVNMPYGVDNEGANLSHLRPFLKGCKTYNYNIRKYLDHIIKSTRDNNIDLNNITDKEMTLNNLRQTILFFLANNMPKKGFIVDSTTLSKAYLDGISKLISPSSWDIIYPLLPYTHSEVIQIGAALGLPDNLIFITKRSDFEKKHKIQMNTLDDYIRNIPNEVSKKGAELIEAKHQKAISSMSGHCYQMPEYQPENSKELLC